MNVLESETNSMITKSRYMSIENPSTEEVESSVHTIETRKPKHVLQLLKNACRTLDCRIASDTLKITKDRRAKPNAPTGKVHLKQERTIVQRGGPLVHENLKFVLVGSAMGAFLFGVAGILPVYPMIVIVLAGLAFFAWVYERRLLQTSYDVEIVLAVDGEGTELKRDIDTSTGTNYATTLGSVITIEATAYSPYPKSDTSDLEAILSDLDDQISDFSSD